MPRPTISGASSIPCWWTGRVHGGVAQGLGQAVYENCVYDEQSGQLLSGSFMDYCLPRADDMPPFALAANGVPTSQNPLGIKGCGEAGAIPAPAAVVNAVLDALKERGVTDIDMPLTPGARLARPRRALILIPQAPGARSARLATRQRRGAQSRAPGDR